MRGCVTAARCMSADGSPCRPAVGCGGAEPEVNMEVKYEIIKRGIAGAACGAGGLCLPLEHERVPFENRKAEILRESRPYRPRRYDSDSNA